MAITETFHNMGFRLTYPDVFNHPKGIVSPLSLGDTGDGIYFMMYNYIAVTEEDVKAMRSKSETGELSNEDSSAGCRHRRGTGIERNCRKTEDRKRIRRQFHGNRKIQGYHVLCHHQPE